MYSVLEVFGGAGEHTAHAERLKALGCSHGVHICCVSRLPAMKRLRHILKMSGPAVELKKVPPCPPARATANQKGDAT